MHPSHLFRKAQIYHHEVGDMLGLTLSNHHHVRLTIGNVERDIIRHDGLGDLESQPRAEV